MKKKAVSLLWVLLLLYPGIIIASPEKIIKQRNNIISVKIGAYMYANDEIPMDYWVNDKKDFNSFCLELSYERLFSKNFGLETHLGHFKARAEHLDWITPYDESFTEIVNSYVSLSAKYHHFLTMNNDLYFGIGPDYYFTQTKYRYKEYAGTKYYSDSDSHNGFGVHGLLGYEYIIYQDPFLDMNYDAPVGIFIEYKYSWVLIKEGDTHFIDDYNRTHNTTHAYNDKNVGTHMLQVGLKWHF